MSAIEIAEITRQPQNTLARGVSLLQEKSLVKRAQDPDDGRRYRLYLTPKGKKLYKSFIYLFEEANEEMVASLSEAERATLDKLLDKMCRAVRASKNWTSA